MLKIIYAVHTCNILKPILGVQLASYVYVARETMSDYQRLLDATGNYQ